MIGIVIAAHGELADVLVTTAMQVIANDVPVIAVGITEEDDAASYENRLSAAVGEVSQGTGVLVLTDMFGGTPSNLGLTLHKAGAVEILTGANLPMIIKAIQLSARGEDLQSAAEQVKTFGRQAITVASEILGFSEGKVNT